LLFSVQTTASHRVPLSAESCPTQPSQPAEAASTSPGLPLPSAHARIEGPLLASVTCPLRSASRVWLPSWRLTPFDSGPVLFHTGGAPGIHPSEPAIHQVSGRFHPNAPTDRSSRRCSRSPKRQAGPTGCGYWVSTLTEAPVHTEAGFSSPATGRSLGFRPFRVLREDLDRDFARSPLTQLAGRRSYDPRQALPQSIDQPSLRLSHAPRQAAPADRQPS
jgi:hypothetical protein